MVENQKIIPSEATVFYVGDKAFKVGDIVQKCGKYWTTIQNQGDAEAAYALDETYRVLRIQ